MLNVLTKRNVYYWNGQTLPNLFFILKNENEYKILWNGQKFKPQPRNINNKYEVLQEIITLSNTDIDVLHKLKMKL